MSSINREVLKKLMDHVYSAQSSFCVLKTALPVIEKAAVDKAKAAIDKPKIPVAGMPGYSEHGAPEDWDTAMGEVRGYRWWYLDLPAAVAGYFTPGSPPDNGMSRQEFLYGAKSQPWTAGRMEARCVRGYPFSTMTRPPVFHEPPEIREACGCGFWAYFSKDLPARAVLAHAGGDTPSLKNEYTVTVPVFGVVRGTGRVIIGEKGFRSQYAEILGLCIPNITATQMGWHLTPDFVTVTDFWGVEKSITTGNKVPCSSQELATRLSETESVLAAAYSGVKVFTSQDLLTEYFPPDKHYS